MEEIAEPSLETEQGWRVISVKLRVVAEYHPCRPPMSPPPNSPAFTSISLFLCMPVTAKGQQLQL